MTLILGIETSCDETATAVVRDGRTVLSERVASQIDLHAKFGGVIPEVASRSHLEALFPLVDESLQEAGVTLGDLDALAVTTTPGLIGCLLVGLNAAKGLALASGVPILGVNHVHAHIYGALMEDLDARGVDAAEGIEWPLVSLVVSGGHTSLYESTAPDAHRLVGRTIDDAAGEAYDKVSALLGLGYPGGPVLDKLAAQGNPKAHDFPRSRPKVVTGGGKAGRFDFSFSGLKTAVLYGVRGQDGGRGKPLRKDAPPRPDVVPADVAASFQAAVVDVLAERLMEAADALGARGLVVCGGVAANSGLRARVTAEAEARGLPLFLPPMRLATDNAVMIAGLGHWLFAEGKTGDLATDVLARTD